MIKRLFVISFLLCFSVKLSSQVYGNEWINFSQKHYRISIPKTGLYRIDSITLANSGIPLVTLDPKNFQLFIKGQEQYIYVKGENDNVFNSTDYIEFYAEKNDCRFDSAAYYNILRLPNPYVPLYNDTNYAYITWNSSVTNNRVIPETDTAFTGYTPADYFYADRVTSFSSHYATGSVASGLLEDPRNIEGEGFGVSVSMGQVVSSNPSQLVYQSSTLPVYIQASYSGSSLDSPFGATYDHHIKVSYSDNTGSTVTLNDTTFSGYKQFLIEKQITSDQLQNSSSVSVTNVNDAALSSIAGNQKNTTHYLRIRYPQKTDFGGASEQVFYLDDAAAPKSYLNIASVLTLTNTPIFYDLTNHKYITVLAASGGAKVLVPNSGAQKKCLLTNSSNVINVTALTAVNQTGYFVNYTATHPDSAYLIVTHKSLLSSANNYKNHRQNMNGGSNNVILADVDDLYDQFAYGNKKNPLAIRNFCKFLIDSLPTEPKYLLLIGKSINNYEIKTNWDSCLVPTMGRPSSDNLFTTGLKGTSSVVPYLPTGRISAKTDATVNDYLAKVDAHEYGITQTDTLGWRKRVLHFAGGINSGQQLSFESYLNYHAGIISDTLYGGKVFTFKKTTTAPIQINISDSVKSMIEYGTSIINFFGHGSTTGFDQSIDDPRVYNNKDKYPLFIANSCYSGNIHLPGITSSSENFTLIKEKGSIGFIASSSSGVEAYLNLLTTELYRALAYRKYYKGIGDALKNACLYNSSSFYPLMEISCLEMTLEGDPYVRLNAFALPDYEIHNSSISFNTASYPDSIGININIRNLGKAIRDTFIVKVERTFPAGNSITFIKQVKAPFNSSVLSFFIPKDFENGIGLNHFSVNIDFFNTISELSETNNATNGSVDLFIPGGDVIPVYPYKYAIIPNTSQITLKVTTADPFAPAANYKIQLDTSDAFQSPILQSTIVNSIGGVIEWTVNLTEGDSTVYFWRITKDSVATTDRINWRESSFEVYRDKNGWGQSHFHQFKNDTYQFVKYKRAQRRFEFENDTKSLECNDGFLPYVAIDAINYKVNNSLEDYYSCSPGGWAFAVFDSISARAMEQYIPSAGLGIYNNCICNGATTFKAIVFGSSNFCGVPTPNWQADMQAFLDSIPPNQKILAWSQQNHHTETYSVSLKTAFEKFGASSMYTIKDTVPYIIYGTKHSSPMPNTAHEAIGINNKSVIQLQDTLKTRWNNGYIASELIGPSVKWNSLHWKQLPQELPNTDSILIQVIGIKANGTRDTLARFTKDSTDIYDLSNYVDASQYPYMQLVARMSDTLYLTPPQLKKWQVYYDEVPECAINPKKGYVISNTTLQEGEGLIVKLPIENIGTLPFTDSLVVTYWIEDKDRVLHYLPQKLKAKPFNPAQVIIDTINFSSYDNLTSNHVNYTGANYLWVDVNPPANSKYQKEQYHFNNVARIAFNVSADKINPLLDVTFDGTHILNGDIISAKPYVLVTLKDENKFLALNDTDDFRVYIRYPNQAADKPLYFANNALQFIPAQLPSNSCKIEWRPELAEDGKYRLIVQAADRTKNVSGATDYNIQFEVINKETVTEVLNYPNPFSTSTKFVFTLTGSETPDIFIIQIMTITGKVVKEITKNDLGNLHIGRNITSYAWDGKDDFGDKLANGVYLYRVITRHNGQAVEKRETDADSFFKKGIGKLVIMR